MPSSRIPRLLAVLLALAVFLGACTSSDATTTTSAGARVTTTTAGESTTTAAGPTTTTRPDLSGLDLPANVVAQLEDLMMKAQELRGLPFLETPTITVLGDAEFKARVAEVTAEGLENLPADQALYELLGLLPAGSNLEDMLGDLYEEQVAGFYDGRTKEIVVPSRSEGLSLVQQGTMIHELVHALTDQHFEASAKREQMIDEDRFDEASAYLALLEGDATLTEFHWVRTLSQRDLGLFLGESLQADMGVIESMPRFIRDSLLFPYDSGLQFVQYLYDRGGWDAVNEAYRIMPDLPASTEQIITPGDFRRDLPVEMTVREVEIPGYALVLTSTWGELGLRLMFDQVLGEERSFQAADGWGGDYYHQWYDGRGRAAFILVLAMDTEDDLQELRRALLDYQARAIEDAYYVWVDEEGGYLHFVVAHDPVVGEQLKTAYGLD
ncbi:MAG: hypothetical protein DIU67_008915 [Actinomycetes bacterium]|jgi:hypothetical protein|nr:MAG: hypothetical protein DIU67_06810 [Actinomycetota bacterium]